MNNSSRRNFLKKLAALSAVPAILTISQSAFSQEKKKKKGDAAAGDGWAIPGQGAAATIGYVEDKSKVAKSAQVDKSGITFAKQTCANCILFQNGNCNIITDANKKVKPTGWCPTWTNNPAIKS